MATALGGAVSGSVNLEVLAQSSPAHLEGRGGVSGSQSQPLTPTLSQQPKLTRNLQASFKGARPQPPQTRRPCLQPICWPVGQPTAATKATENQPCRSLRGLAENGFPGASPYTKFLLRTEESVHLHSPPATTTLLWTMRAYV